MVRRKAKASMVGTYKSKRHKSNGIKVFQLLTNRGTKRGLFKKGRNRRNYIPQRYKKNVTTSGAIRHVYNIRQTGRLANPKRKQMHLWHERVLKKKRRYRSPTITKKQKKRRKKKLKKKGSGVTRDGKYYPKEFPKWYE